MVKKSSSWINDFFAAGSRDLTPPFIRHAAHILYAPVSRDSEVSRRCASVLSQIEMQRASRFADEFDRAQFVQRRAFRRFCGASVLGSTTSLSHVHFEETETGRPHLAAMPGAWFSFSSCRLGLLAAWSLTHAIGVDVEDQTRSLDILELSRRFFSVSESKAVEHASGLGRLRIFFRLWCLKEAALKSIGEGLPFGLDAFQFELNPLAVVRAPSGFGGRMQFTPHIIAGTGGCAALVVRNMA
jgi:4'-phosphopantetheinyl transferase